MPSILKARCMLVSLLALVGFWTPSAGLADVYKWTDAQGRTYYSDRQPPADAQQVEVITAPAGEDPSAAGEASITTIRTLAHRLLQQLSEPGAPANPEAQALAQALARQVETDAAPDWNAVRGVAESLAPLLPPEVAQGPSGPARTLQRLLAAMPPYTSAAPTPAASAQAELERIRNLTATLTAERKAREAEWAALEQQRRQARQSAQPKEQPSGQLDDDTVGYRYYFGPSDPCYLYPNRCFPYYSRPPYSQPPVMTEPEPYRPPPRPGVRPWPRPWERPHRPCPPPSREHRGSTSWQVGC